MIIDIRNLGAVEHAEIDLRPLTIFVGPNNTGKTWVAYTLSAILGPYGWDHYKTIYAAGEVSATYPRLDNVIQQVLDKGNANIDLVQFADECGETYINDVGNLAKQWMQKFMGTERASFDNLEVRVSLGEAKKRFLERVKTYPITGAFSPGRQRKRALLSGLKEPGESKLYFYTAAEGNELGDLPIRAVKEFLAGGAFRALHNAFFPHIYTFPTERTTFVTFPLYFFAESRDETRVADEMYDQPRRVKPLARPVSGFLDMVVDAFRRGQLGRDEQAKGNPMIQQYIHLARLLEMEILGGGVDFSTPRPQELRRELLFQPAKDISLEMSVVSSMVKELSPLTLCLRYLAEPDELLIIDEPEMNLHPKAQVQLVEFLAMLVNAGLQVLFTTHSPYIVDHLVNLMKAAQHNDKEAIREKFYLKRAEAFIPKEKVSVYLFENGTAKNILDKEGVIDWGTFGDISDQISDLYFEI